MNNYKRLTDSETAVMLKNTEGSSWDSEDMEAQRYIRLAELEDKIENRTLVDLPCKVGDTVYTIEGGIIEEYEVLGVLVQFEELFFKILRKRDCLCKFWGSRSVFHTKAKAEAKLKELKGE